MAFAGIFTIDDRPPAAAMTLACFDRASRIVPGIAALVRSAMDDHGHDHGGHEPGLEAKKEHGPGDGHAHHHDGPLGEDAELVFSLICGALALGGWVAGKLGAPLACNVAFWFACAFGGWFTTRRTGGSVRLDGVSVAGSVPHAPAGSR